MKKLVLISAFLAFALGAVAEDSYIYWMVANDATGTGYGGAPLGGSSYTAKIRAVEGREWTDAASGSYLLDIYYAADDRVGGRIGQEVNGITFGSGANNLTYFANLAQYAGTGADWTYFVEIYNDGRILARSEQGLPYSEESIVALSGLATPGDLWSPDSFIPVPEPNSALLMLIGCAALALRRRKQTVA